MAGDLSGVSWRCTRHLCFIFYVIILGIMPASVWSRRPLLRYMTNHCSDTINVYSSLLVAFTPPASLPEVRSEARHCKVTLHAMPTGGRVMIHFLEMGISSDQDHHDSLMIYDSSPEETELTPKGGLYGSLDHSSLIVANTATLMEDYISTKDEITVEYVGIPTVEFPGFKVLVTVIQGPEPSGRCPERTFRCPEETNMCVPASVACDGFHNCGLADFGDEQDCDSYETVTNLIDHYSLTYDIFVVIMLPPLVFVLVSVIIYCILQRYIRTKINVLMEVPVTYRASSGGQAKLKRVDEKVSGGSRLYAPPSYEDVVTPNGSAMAAPPPAYSSLADLVLSGAVEVVDSEDDKSPLSTPRRHRTYNKWEIMRQNEDCAYDSGSSLERERLSPDPRIKAHHHHGALQQTKESQRTRSREKHVKFSDTDDEEETKAKRNRKKGGKSKKTHHCMKRRADDLTCVSPECGDRNVENIYANFDRDTNVVGKSSEPAHLSLKQCPSSSSLPPYESYQSTQSPQGLASHISSHKDEMSLATTTDKVNQKATDNQSSLPFNHKPYSKTTHNSSDEKITPGGKFEHPMQASPRQETSVPCVINISDPLDPTSATYSISKCSSSPQQSSPALNGSSSSPSPSSSSATDPDTNGQHSSTESRVASNLDSRTESNGSISDHHGSIYLPNKPLPVANSRLDDTSHTLI